MEARAKARVAVVTGGTGALGRTVVETLLGEGWRVHVPFRSPVEADELRSRLGGPRDDLRLAPADLGDPASVETYFTDVSGWHGRLDALCALVGGFTAGALADTSPADWERMLRLNATSAFLCCRAAVPLLRRSGGGALVTVTALPAVETGGPGMSAYAASKAAVLNLSLSLAGELRDQGIRVNAIAPEILDTAANRAAMPDADRGRWLDPRAVAEVVAFLVGDGGAPLTGNVLKLKRT